MDNKILFGNTPEQPENTDTSKINTIENTVKPNLFLGRTETETKGAKFPDWDIVPSNPFINPRIKKQ